MPADQTARKRVDSPHPGEISREYKKRREGHKQHKICLQEHLPVEKQQYKHHAGQHDRPVEDAQNHEKAQGKKREIQPEAPPVDAGLLPEEGVELFPGQEKAAREDQRQRERAA